MTRGFLDGRWRLAAATVTLLALLGAQGAWAPPASPTLWLLLGCLFGAALAWRRSPHDDRATAESFRHLIENAPDFVTLTDANGQVRFRSAALQHFLGPHAEGLRKAPVHPDDVPKDAALFAEALSTPGAVRIADLRVRRRDGEWRSLEVVVRNLLHEPQVRGLLVYSRDVTDRKRAEVRQELRVQAARLLSTSARVSEAMPRLLRLLCEGLGLAAGAAILPGPDGAKTFTWPSEAGPSADTLRLAREVALGGDTWAVGAVAVPIRVASGLLGAQAFSTHGRSVLEPGLLELLSEIGLQVGQLLARDRAEETLRRREDRFRALVEDSADGIALFDAEGRIQWTGANTAILGYDQHEVEGRRVADLVHHEDLQRLEAFFDEVPGDPSRFVTVQFRLQHKDGSWRWLEGSLRNLLQNPAVRGVVANYRDVTLQRRLQDDLVRAAAEWRLTFDAIASPVLVVRPPSTLVRLNDAGQALAGRAFDALVGHDLIELGEGEPWRTAAVLAQQVGVSHRPRTVQIRDTREGKAWEIAATLLSLPEAKDARVIVVARDVTETVELQASLRRSETLSAMGSLVAGVAHEVRNPLFSIGANLDALAAELGEEGPAGSHFGVLRSEMARLNVLMQDLLEYGKPGSPRFEAMPLADVVRVALGAVRAQADRAGIRLEADVSGDLLVQTDRGRLARVFQNLVENALQHAPPSSAVVVRARAGENGLVSCVVEDSGPGFEEADLPRVFEPFFTRRRGGTGLGLSIVARIAEEHGGRVTAENRAAGGACVRVELPRVVPQVDREPATLADPVAHGAGA